jgi:MSHA pilin protein MshC
VLRPQKKPPHDVAAFTLLELIITLIVVGILAAMAAPVFLSPSSFASTAGRDDMLAALRQAQQRAMADSSKIVQFVTTASTFSIVIDGSPIAKADLSGNYPQSFESGVTVAPATTITYQTLGTTTATSYTFSGGEKICVETSGYAHAC